MNPQSMKVDVSFSALRELAEHARDTDAAATAYARRPVVDFTASEYMELAAAARQAALELRQFVTFDVVLVMLDAIDHPDARARCEVTTFRGRCSNVRNHPGDHTPVRDAEFARSRTSRGAVR